jgi:hypothetical protein
MEAVFSPETLALTYETDWFHNPEFYNMNRHLREYVISSASRPNYPPPSHIAKQQLPPPLILI